MYDSFDAYHITGNATDWLAQIGVSAITIELKQQHTIERHENWAAIRFLLAHYRLPLR